MGKKSKKSKAEKAEKKESSTTDNNVELEKTLIYQPTVQADIDAIKTPPVLSTNVLDPAKAGDDVTCWICLENGKELLRRNCACRGEHQGFAQ